MLGKKFIFITTQFEGFHQYPNAPYEVSFLKNKHRHIFKLKIWISVNHNDRELEFIMFKWFIDKLIQKNNFNNMSCEMISDELYEKINKEYPSREVRIELSEDGENGSYTEY